MTDRSFPRWIVGLIWISIAGAFPATAGAQNKADLSTVDLPYVFHDDRGTEWDIQQDGSVGSGGNDLFDSGGHLSVGQEDFSSEESPQLDSAANELHFPAMSLDGLSVSRYVACNPKLSYLRYTEILENPSATPVKTTLHIAYNLPRGVEFANPLSGKKSKQSLGMVVGDSRNALALVGAIDGGKVAPRYAPQADDCEVHEYWDVTVPAHQTVVLVHLICRRANPAEGAKVIEELSGKSILKGLPPEITRRLANFPHGETFVGDQEFLRGDLFDVIELRNGDKLFGTLAAEKYTLNTFYGRVELPAANVMGELSTGEFRPRQLFVTTDGEIFSGTLQDDSVSLQLAGGQTTHVPLSQIKRMGYRHRPSDPEEMKSDKPFVLLRGGDRLLVQPPTSPFVVSTRYGTVSIKPEAIDSLDFAAEEQSVHQIQLSDGSKFLGVINGKSFEIKLATTGQSVAFPAGMLRRIQLSTPDKALETETAALNLTNGDVLVGPLGGVIKIQTTFDTLNVNGDEIRSIQPGNGPGGEVEITLWDNATVGGQLEGDQLTVTVAGGGSMKLPVGLIEQYTNPQPRPPEQMAQKIKAMVADLNADDWAARDRAQDQLIAIGPGAAGILHDLRASLPAETQQRIDWILKAYAPKPPEPAAPTPRQVIID